MTSKRVQIARTSLAACEAGSYLVGDRRVELAEALAAARAGTRGYELGVDALAPPAHRDAPTTIAVTAESTTEAIVRLAHAEHLGVLNFASAKNPGGGFLGGAQAQEEALARSSGLYPCLLEVPEHYARNRAFGSALYLDLAIVSPRVPVFRTDAGGWLPDAVLATIITCAAPNKGAIEQQLARREGDARDRDVDAIEVTLRRRADFVLALAAHAGVTDLVLGAWGCGVFRNDPALVADAFRAPLASTHARAFASVTFAILGGEGPNHAAFVSAFG